jgi:peptide/nickel transport system permease protein
LNILATVLVVLVLFATLFGDALAPYPPTKPDLTNRLKPPSTAHWFGADDFGRDILSRVLSGAKISIQVAAVVLSIALVVGVLVGGLAGMLGGWVDQALMRLTDLFLAFPALILAAAIGATLGNNLTNTMIALSTVYWPWYARLMRGQALTMRHQDFIIAAHAIGVSRTRILWKHLLPNVAPILLVQISLDIGYAILYTSSLSFLGLGAQRPTPEWGLMLSDSRDFVRTAPWTMFFPGMALTLTVLAFNLLGDGLRDFLDPRLRGQP